MEVEHTVPALFSASQLGRGAGAAGEDDDVFVPIAQLGAGPDGTAVLARRGDRLVEVLQLAFGPDSPRWAELAARVRALAAVDHPAVRAVVALDDHPPRVVLEGDRSPPLVELIEQASLDLPRALVILGDLARGVAAAHRIGVCHGGLHPWSVHVGANDRPRIELTQLSTKPVTHAWVAACAAPELALAEPDATADVYALGRLAELFATSAGRAHLVRSPQLARVHELRVTASGGVRRLDVALGEPAALPALCAGDQLLALANPTERELLVRVERAGDRAFALTAARVMSTAAFRELFPDQSLAPGRLMAVTQASLVIAQLDDAAELFRELGDEKAFPVAARFFDHVGALAKELGGTLVKTFGGLAIAAFERPGPAVEAALRVQALADADPVTRGLGVRVAVHRGPLMAMSHAGRLDYFGQNLEAAVAIAAATPPAVVALTSAVCFDTGVAERVKDAPDQLGIHSLADGAWVLRLRAPRAEPRALPAPEPSLAIAIRTS